MSSMPFSRTQQLPPAGPIPAPSASHWQRGSARIACAKNTCGVSTKPWISSTTSASRRSKPHLSANCPMVISPSGSPTRRNFEPLRSRSRSWFTAHTASSAATMRVATTRTVEMCLPSTRPSWVLFSFTKTCSPGVQWTQASCFKHSSFQQKPMASTRAQSVCSRLGAARAGI